MQAHSDGAETKGRKSLNYLHLCDYVKHCRMKSSRLMAAAGLAIYVAANAVMLVQVTAEASNSGEGQLRGYLEKCL